MLVDQWFVTASKFVDLLLLAGLDSPTTGHNPRDVFALDFGCRQLWGIGDRTLWL
jgi:hypothetical protein